MLFMLLLISFVYTCNADEFVGEGKETMTPKIENNNVLPQEMNDFAETKNIGNMLEKIEEIAALMREFRKENKHTNANTEEKSDEIVEVLQDLIHLLKVPENAHKFLNIKGVDRIITLIVETDFERLKKQVLIVIKTLFNVVPAATSKLIPIRVVDKLLDIFEHNDNLALKTHALDVMYSWLPNNPRVQARVMKLKGLEPFYEQVSKLDATVIYTLLDLFNIILEEHITARDAPSLNNKDDKMKLYQKIGLVERMSTPPVCNGLLDIFELILPFNENNDQFSKLIVTLMKNIKPFCLKIYYNKRRALKVFETIKKYFIDIDKTDSLIKLGFNLKEVRMILEDYTEKINDNSRDEF